MKKQIEVKGNKDTVVNGRIRKAVKQLANQECKKKFKKGLSSMLEQLVMDGLDITEERVRNFKPSK